MADVFEQLVAKTFEDLGEILDFEVVSYLTDSLRDTESLSSAEDLRETFSAFSIKFAELGCAEQDEFIASLLSSGENALTEIPPQDPPMVNIAFKDCFPNVQLEDEDGEGASFEKTFLKDLRIDQTSVMSTSQQQVVCPEIELLASYCPVNMRRELLEDLLYRRCGGCLETAAGWLVEDGDFAVKLAALETVYDENGAIIKDNNASKPADPDDTIKRSIVNKYYLEAVEKTGGIDGKVKAWGEPACMPTGGKKATVRYRNGVIVSTKGDKFIIEKPPEWDGGSRGRVKSKRKGGVGWH